MRCGGEERCARGQCWNGEPTLTKKVGHLVQGSRHAFLRSIVTSSKGFAHFAQRLLFNLKNA